MCVKYHSEIISYMYMLLSYAQSSKRATNSESKDIPQRYGSKFDNQGYIEPVKIIFEKV